MGNSQWNPLCNIVSSEVFGDGVDMWVRSQENMWRCFERKVSMSDHGKKTWTSESIISWTGVQNLGEDVYTDHKDCSGIGRMCFASWMMCGCAMKN